MEKFRSRRFCLLLYTSEDDTHIKALEYIKNNYENYAYIVHDKDTNKDNELKKAHTHIVLEFNNARWSSSLAEELGITPNYLQNCKNFEKALDYLIHFNDDTKYQYDISEVKGNLKKQLIKQMNSFNKDENEIVKEIIEMINNSDLIDVSTFVKIMCDWGYYSYFRRSLGLFLRLIDNHNITAEKCYEKTTSHN